jgi:hypothetical protein
LQIPHILKQLERIDTPVIDRAICERLFGVKRRRAIDMMRFFGGYRSGNTVLVDRSVLIQRLREIADSSEFISESKRKEQLTNKLDLLHHASKSSKVKLPVTSQAITRTADNLPSGMTLIAGSLIVDFVTPEELFAKLYEFSQAAANDFDRMCDVLARTRC